MSELLRRQNEFVELFNDLDSWLDRFQYIIDIGNQLPDIDENLRTESNRVGSCISKTYLLVTYSGELNLQGWSNSAFPSGMIQLLRNIFDHVSQEELNSTPVFFHIKTGLIDNLSGQRRIAFCEMLDKIMSFKMSQ